MFITLEDRRGEQIDVKECNGRQKSQKPFVDSCRLLFVVGRRRRRKKKKESLLYQTMKVEPRLWKES